MSGGAPFTRLEKQLTDSVRQLRGALRTIALTGLQSKLYDQDADFREAVDDALELLGIGRTSKERARS